ncbi:MAG TPA: hypothetical protein VGA08_01710 [Candidatus Saccharimonadales bacterium]
MRWGLILTIALGGLVEVLFIEELSFGPIHLPILLISLMVAGWNDWLGAKSLLLAGGSGGYIADVIGALKPGSVILPLLLVIGLFVWLKPRLKLTPGPKLLVLAITCVLFYFAAEMALTRRNLSIRDLRQAIQYGLVATMAFITVNFFSTRTLARL